MKKFSLLSILISFSLLFTSCIVHHYCTSQDKIQEQHIVIKEQVTDSSMYKTILPFKAQIDKDLNIVIATTKTPLEKNLTCNNLTQLVYESMTWYADSILGKNKNFTVLINYGGLRANIPQGNIIKKNIYELMPFDNTIVILELTNEQMQNILLKINNNHKLLLKSKNKNNSTLLVTSDYLYQGGDGCSFLKELKKVNTPSYLIRDAIIKYCTIQKQLDIPCFYQSK